MKNTFAIIVVFLALLCNACAKPVPVRIHEKEPDCLVTATAEAIDWWNEIVNEQIFDLRIYGGSKKRKVGYVTIEAVDRKDDEHTEGHTSAHLAKRIITIEMLKNAECNLWTELNVAHELGHAIRLRHFRGKDDPENIMYHMPTGYNLTKKQIKKARRAAFLWSGKLFSFRNL